MLTVEQAAQIMGMKAHKEVVSVVEHPDGTLVTTKEGARTLIRPDRSCVAVAAGSPILNSAGRGSVTRFKQRAPIRVEATVGEPVRESQEAETPSEVPAGNAGSVLEWVGADRDRAARALAMEKLRESPRAGLTAQLEKLAG